MSRFDKIKKIGDHITLLDCLQYKRSMIFVISGPSGVGKDTIIQKIRQNNTDYHQILTTTSRPKRINELDGVHYNFITRHEFENGIKAKKFIEWAKVYDNYYGVSRNEIENAFKNYTISILKVDVQGVKSLRKVLKNAIYIFILPSSIDELKSRLMNRNDTSHVDLNLRLGKVNEEMKYIKYFDYFVINKQNEIEQAVNNIQSIIQSQLCKVTNDVLKFFK